MKKFTIIVMIATIASKFLGFFRELSLSSVYGASNISDAYLVAISVPTVVFGFLSMGISAGYIPLSNTVINKEGDVQSHQFTSNVINILMIICTIMIAIVLIFTKQIVLVFASGFDGETLRIAVQFTQIAVFSIYFFALVSVFSGFLQIRDNFLIPAIIGIPYNLILIGSILVSKSSNEIILSYGFVIATISQLFLLYPFVLKKGYRHKLTTKFKDPYVIDMYKMITPIMLGVSVTQLNLLVDKTIASRIAVGGISSLNYANTLISFVTGIFVLSIVVVFYPKISKLAVENDSEGLNRVLKESVSTTFVFVIPSSVGFIIFSKEIIQLLFGRGVFTDQAIQLTSEALVYYSMGITAIGLREILVKTLFALNDTKTPMINSIYGVILNVILNIILSAYMGIKGLAAATSISTIFTATLLFIKVRKTLSFQLANYFEVFTKILVSSIIMGLVGHVVYRMTVLIWSYYIALAVAIIVCVIVYFLVLGILNFGKIKELKQLITKKLKK